MKRTQINQIAGNKTNQSSINSNNGSNTLLSILLHRLELMGLFKSFMVRTSLGRCSSMVRSIIMHCGRFSISRHCISFPVFLLIAVMGLFFSLVPSNPTYADNTITLNISGDNDGVLGFDILPNSINGSFAKSSNLTIDVSLSGVGGYTVGIMASDTTNLVNTNDNTKYFESITSVITEETFSADSTEAATNYNMKWGYKPSNYNSVANTNNFFYPAPDTNGDIIDYTSDDNASGSYSLALGARASKDAATGAYTGTFIITAVANVTCNASATAIGEAICMQDMNDSVINSMVTHTQYQLYDNRDWKPYYVAKMNDGRVWMTQNLDLDLETTPTNISALNSKNTDLNTFGSQDYTSANGYKCYNSNGDDITSTTTNNCTNPGDVIQWTPLQATLANNQYASWNSSNYLPRSWDGGDYYYYTSGTTSNDSNFTMSQCTSAGHTTAECTHYHIGNYYNWSAAVASNSTSNLTANYTVMGNSICPAGWRLPAGKTTTTSTDPGYYAEINYTWYAEGIVSNYTTNSATWKTTNDVLGFNAIRTAPMYMVRAGYRNGTGAAVNSPRNYGYYHTNTIYGSNYDYQTYFYSSYPYPYYSYYYRSYGDSIRCVARQGNTGSTTIIFDKNADDATGTMNTQTISANTRATLTSNSYSRTNYVFNGWNTQADGKGVSYANAAAYYAATGTDNKNVTLYADWAVQVTIKTVTGISSVYIREVGSSTNLCSTSSTSGTACKLKPSTTYTLGATNATGYTFSSWTKTGAGSIANTGSISTTVTTGTSATTITPAATPNSYNITVNFVGGVSSVTFANATYGTQTVSSSGGTVSLKYNQRYDITVTLNNGNYFVSWEKVSGSGTLGSTSTMNTYFTPSTGTATLRITAANTRIKTADGIDSVTVSTTGGSQVCTTTDATTGAYCNLTLGTAYNITATTHQGYTFSSWSNTGNGTIGSSTSSTTTFTPAQSSAIDVITPSATGNPYTVTIVFGNEHVSSVTVDGEIFTTSGGTKTLTAGTAYTISGTTDLNTVAFSASANGKVSGSTFTLYGDATLTAEGLDRIYIQDLTLANCPADGMTVYDKRDEKDYTVKLINGQCWMTQNLRYLGDTGSAAGTMTIGNNNSNVSNKSITLYSLNSSNTGNFGTYSSHCDSNGYNYACVYDSGNTSTGVWYNYYAASAGTISGSPNYTAATSSICPAGWHLPSGPNTTANTDLNKLFGNTTSSYQPATSGLTAFSAVAGGSYSSGSLSRTEHGSWWSATVLDYGYRYNLYYNSSNGQFNGGVYSIRYSGKFVRCVRSS